MNNPVHINVRRLWINAMGTTGTAEDGVCRDLVQRFRAIGYQVDRERTVVISRRPRRYRQIDVALVDHNGMRWWIEIDAKNHRGRRNLWRDIELARLTIERDAMLLHWPLWQALQNGIEPIVQSVLEGHGHPGLMDDDYHPYGPRRYHIRRRRLS